MSMEGIVFANKEFLYLLFVLIPMLVWYVLKQRTKNAPVQLSDVSRFKNVTSYKNYLIHFPFIFRCIVVALVIVALARPQIRNSEKSVVTEGIDIVLAIDISESMLAMDFKPNRIEASKDVAIQFVSGRNDDRFGLVVFGSESFTQCPLTTDHATVINLINSLRTGIIEGGTAIGSGLAMAVKRLKDSKAKSKVVILLTDGVNNRGEIDPLTAADIAHTFGVRVYTIGVGSGGQVPYPVRTPWGTQTQYLEVPIDEEVLNKIAQTTGGKYFRATNKEKLIEIYAEIDKMEKSKIEDFNRDIIDDKYFILIAAACALLLLEFIFDKIILRRIP